MIPLDSPRWDELWPVAGEIDLVLEDLDALHHSPSDDAFLRRLSGLMVMIWHDNDSCPAAPAAAPYLAALCEGASLRRRVACIRAIALFESARHGAIARGIEWDIPADVRSEYLATLARLPAMIAACLDEPWDFGTAVDLAGALIVAKGYPPEGHEVMCLRPRADRQADGRAADGDEIPW